MATWKQRTVIFGAGLIAVVSGSACSPGSQEGSNKFDPLTQPSGLDADATRPSWPRALMRGLPEVVSIGVACGVDGELLADGAHLNDEGFVVIPGATATISSVISRSEDSEFPSPAKQMFYRGQNATGTFQSSLDPTDPLAGQFNDPSVSEIFLGDESGIGESKSGLSLSYRANVPDDRSQTSAPDFSFAVDYFGGSMSGELPDEDENTLDRDVGSYSGSENSDPFVSSFVDPADDKFQGNLMDLETEGEPYLEPVEVPSSDYQTFVDLPNIPGEVVSVILEPLDSVNRPGQKYVCASAAIIPPPKDMVLA